MKEYKLKRELKKEYRKLGIYISIGNCEEVDKTLRQIDELFRMRRV